MSIILSIVPSVQSDIRPILGDGFVNNVFSLFTASLPDHGIYILVSSFAKTSGNVLYVTYSEQCCQYQTNESRLNAILSAIGGGTATFSSRDSITDTEPINSTYTGSGGIAEALNGLSIVCAGCGRYLNSAGNGIKLAKFFGYWGPNETDSDTNGILVGVNDINWDHQTQYRGTGNSYAIMQWIVGLYE